MNDDPSAQAAPPAPPAPVTEPAPDREWVTTVSVKAGRPPAEATFTGQSSDEH